MVHQESGSQTQPANKSPLLVATPLWILCVITGLLLWQMFELNANLRTHNDKLSATTNAVQNLDGGRFQQQVGYLHNINNNLAAINNNLDGINQNVAGINKGMSGAKGAGK